MIRNKKKKKQIMRNTEKTRNIVRNDTINRRQQEDAKKEGTARIKKGKKHDDRNRNTIQDKEKETKLGIERKETRNGRRRKGKFKGEKGRIRRMRKKFLRPTL
ncbi:hypothetical protein RUM43_012704 [Polyplax serrata]|uniref:Uncharacterized protein n=1 Tax=Polyplax serrata TaxID=468196 RepID=A0AAN8NYB8_POLSC